jgi:hypothetical protein
MSKKNAFDQKVKKMCLAVDTYARPCCMGIRDFSPPPDDDLLVKINSCTD